MFGSGLKRDIIDQMMLGGKQLKSVSDSLHYSPKVLVIYYKPPGFRGIWENTHWAFALESDGEETTSSLPDFPLNTFWA